MKQCLFNIYRLIFVAFVILLFASCNEKKKFEGYLYPIKENGLYGYIDSVGNRIIEHQNNGCICYEEKQVFYVGMHYPFWCMFSLRYK